MTLKNEQENMPWLVFLQCGAVLYLLFELSFNARLLTAAGGVPDPSRIHGLELAGRLVAGVGATLMAWRMMGFRRDAFRQSVIRLAVAAAIIIPAVYAGQKIIIDGALSQATPAEKRGAYIAALARKSMTDGVVAFSGLKAGADPARAATFNATLGIFIMKDETMLKEIEAKMDDIAMRSVYHAAGGDELWKRYQGAHDKINAALKEYASGSAQVTDYQGQSSAKAEEAWNKLQEILNTYWTRLDTRRQVLKGSKSLLISFAKAELTPLFQKLIECNGACAGELTSGYGARMNEKFGGAVPLDWWCVGWNGQGAPPAYAPATTKSCPGPDMTMSQVITLMLERQFKKESGGLDPSVTYSGFISSPGVQQKIKEELAKQGVDLSGLVFPLEKTQFLSVMTPQVGQAASHAFENKVEEAIGMKLEPGLDPNSLLQRPDVRQAVAAKYGLDPAIELGLSRAEFEKRVLLPKIKGEADKIKASIDAPEALPEHENALRFLIIPPVALVFSLFFTMLNAGSLAVSAAAAAAPRLKRMKAAVGLGLMAAIMFVPFMLEAPGKDNAMYAASLKAMREKSPVVSAGVDWLNRVEPHVLPLGEGVRRNLLFGVTFGYGDEHESK